MWAALPVRFRGLLYEFEAVFVFHMPFSILLVSAFADLCVSRAHPFAAENGWTAANCYKIQIAQFSSRHSPE